MKAIILAAGIGTRLRPLTLTTPKALTIVNDLPLIERQIKYIKENGIEDIIVVTGYLSDKFNYLIQKFNVKIVENKEYDRYNNIYTMDLVKEYLGDSYVIDADIYISRNIFSGKRKGSAYYSEYKSKFKNEWKLIFDKEDKVNRIDIVEEGEGYILSGVSYWSEKDAKIIRENIVKIMNEEDFTNYYWDDVVRLNVDKLNIDIVKLEDGDIYEIDSLEELESLIDKL